MKLRVPIPGVERSLTSLLLPGLTALVAAPVLAVKTPLTESLQCGKA